MNKVKRFLRQFFFLALIDEEEHMVWGRSVKPTHLIVDMQFVWAAEGEGIEQRSCMDGE